MFNTISLDTAKKMLPLIRLIVSDIVNAWCTVTKNVEKLEKDFLSTPQEQREIGDIIRNTKSLTKIITKRIDEIEELGCFIENFKEGIVDFPSLIDKEEVMLCWKLGEEDIRHYHRRGENVDNRLLIVRELE